MTSYGNISRYTAGLLLLLALLLAACGQPGPSTPPAEEPTPSESETTRGFDPLGLPQDDRVVPQVSPQREFDLEQQPFVTPEPIATEHDTTDLILPDLPVAYDTLNHEAYRVQLLTTKLYGEARKAERVAHEIFDQPVYVDYEVPYYKLRVGSFADRETAEEYQLRAKSAGYRNAWVVLVMVDVKQAPPLYDLDSTIVPDSIVVPDSLLPDTGGMLE